MFKFDKLPESRHCLQQARICELSKCGNCTWASYPPRIAFVTIYQILTSNALNNLRNEDCIVLEPSGVSIFSFKILTNIPPLLPNQMTLKFDRIPEQKKIKIFFSKTNKWPVLCSNKVGCKKNNTHLDRSSIFNSFKNAEKKCTILENEFITNLYSSSICYIFINLRIQVKTEELYSIVDILSTKLLFYATIKSILPQAN